MEALNPSSPIHFYDTRARRIACGVSGLDHRSTKHPRQVTCQACAALVGDQPALAGAGAAAPSGGAPA
jgi:hypothetical protein